ncbi:hypothetical protein [Aliiroseovarius sp. F20344]|uniref:hypothetical protein n=1 Tax=Aliiroseovarius sp. F20344 TaxID=2926414 RepID=UPI001FF4A8E5|nr:hypothetical protein [Aliiroseovarius sp. F20344]MCK0143718.1 hypothetical protein [Aliiroseovarius sp. F20344]
MKQAVQSKLKILFLGTTRDLADLNDVSSREVFMACSVFSRLSTQQLSDLEFDAVVSHFICDTLDCLEVSQKLVGAGFKGPYYVLVADIPDPKIIASEINHACPDINIRIVTTPLLI